MSGVDAYQQAWFNLADEDNDGVVSGAEAVAFFTRSGLPKKALAEVHCSAGSGPAEVLSPRQ